MTARYIACPGVKHRPTNGGVYADNRPPARRTGRSRTMAKLFFRYAAMNAGKSTALLQVAHNYEERGHAVRLFTAGVDDRYGKG